MTAYHYNPPHAVARNASVESLVESFRLGRPVPAIAVYGEQAITGSHRIRAYDLAWTDWSRDSSGEGPENEPEIDVVEVPEIDIRNALLLIDKAYLCDVSEWHMLAQAIYLVTDDEDVKSALEDQRHDYEGWTLAHFVRYSGVDLDDLDL